MKRIAVAALAFAICLVTFPAFAQGRSMALEIDSGYVLISSEGAELTRPGEYAYIQPASQDDTQGENTLFIARPAYDETSSDLYLLMDNDGKALTEPVYDYLYEENGMIYFTQNRLQGVMDRDLNVVVPAEYTALAPNGEGGYLALNSDPYDDRPDGVYFIDAQGAETATGVSVLYGLGVFSDGLMPAIAADTSRMGCLDTRGNWAIQPQFDYVGPFAAGRAEATLDSGCGLIDTGGNWLVTPKYNYISMNGSTTGNGGGNMIIALSNEGTVELIDSTDYHVKKTFRGDNLSISAYFDMDYAILYTDDAITLIDAEGEEVLSTVSQGYIDLWSDMNGRAIVRRAAWGENCVYLCALTGEDVAGPYRDISYLCNQDGRAYFTVSDFEVHVNEGEGGWQELWEVDGTRKMGVIDQDGNTVIEMGAYSRIESLGGGFLMVQTANERGIVDLQNNYLARYSIE